MPNRIIKESINESRDLSACSLFAQDLFKRIITYADDYGRFNADTQIMLARLYPREMDIVTQEDVVDALVELSGIQKINFYTSESRHDVYGCFPNWKEHQRVRDSKNKCPEPNDTSVNDWYLRRFVPIDMKAEIIERDGFKCKICGKFLTTCKDAKRFAKLGNGMFHIDHIVPCNQGGRATLENLQLTCPACNLTRKRRFTFEEIVEFAFLPKGAASCGDVQQVSARVRIESNPIQSNPNPNPNPKESTHAHGQYGWVKLNDEEYARLLQEFGQEELTRCIQYVDESAQSTGNKNKWKDWNLVIRRCHNGKWGLNQTSKTKQMPSAANHKPIVPNKTDAAQVNKFLEELRKDD